MTTEQLLNKWERLNQEEQEKVLIFIESLAQSQKFEQKNQENQNQETTYQPKTELGKKLWQIRQKIIVDPNVKLLDWDGINSELDEIRGRNKYDADEFITTEKMTKPLHKVTEIKVISIAN